VPSDQLTGNNICTDADHAFHTLSVQQPLSFLLRPSAINEHRVVGTMSRSWWCALLQWNIPLYSTVSKILVLKDSMVDINCILQQFALTTGNSGFAVSHGRTAKALKRTANSLPRVFRWGARQRAHGSILHGKTPLPCAEKKRTAKRALCHAPDRNVIFTVRFQAAHVKD
jgi:hypothetical protein